ncbi:hypothetical protein [Neotamlana laminarinivorans]|uniref:Uncharacterized protein n=1 Tax=Neotamlana laminarinivorans TaxID=2883124 RepID=A0A9X1I1S4_9FLAO|nr:hypothetical protein [Tamlana laminarinivorans]MCB4800209.1 hypothetical protein [Tamlana laminarinivorans]
MRFNRIRHKLLHKLYLRYNNDLDSKDLNAPRQTVSADKVGLTLLEIDSFLGNKKNDRELILSELYKNKEIEFFDLKAGKGCMINEDYGISAYSNKKYLNENYRILKNVVLFILPIIGLVIALINLNFKFNSFKKTKNTEIENLNSKVENIEKSIFEMKNKAELKTDSLNLK